MARRTPPETPWPENPFDRLDLETVFASGDDVCLPIGWTWRDVERAWSTLGSEYMATSAFDDPSDCWALREWGAP